MSIRMLREDKLIDPKDNGVELTEEMLSWPIYYVDDYDDALPTEFFKRILKVLRSLEKFKVHIYMWQNSQGKELYTSGYCCFVVFLNDLVVYAYPKDTRKKIKEKWNDEELKSFFLDQIGK